MKGYKSSDFMYGNGASIQILVDKNTPYNIEINGKQKINSSERGLLSLSVSPGTHTVQFKDLTYAIENIQILKLNLVSQETAYIIFKDSSIKRTTREEQNTYLQNSTKGNNILAIITLPIWLPIVMIAALFSGGG